MAQSLSPAGPESGRISQILPSVKCSSCNQPVPIAELGEHVCATPPPMPAAVPKPPMSPTSTSFFQQKYQKLISANRPATPQTPAVPQPAQPPLQSSSAGPQQRPGPSPSPLSQRRSPSPSARVSSPLARPASNASASSTSSLNVPVPGRVPSPLARGSSPGADKVAFPTRPGPSEPTPRVPSPLSPSRHLASEPTRVATPVSMSSRTSSEPARFMSPDAMKAPLLARTPSPAMQRAAQLPPPPPQSTMPLAPARAPSVASTRSVQMGVRHPVQSSPAPFVPVPGAGPANGIPTLGPLQQRPRAATSADAGPEIIYSTPQRTGPPPGPMRGPPLNLDTHVTVSQHQGSMHRYAPSTVSVRGMMSPQDAAPAHAEIDTKTGGEAGMAGVGRRGFAAAARAAMFAQQMGMHGIPLSEHHFPTAESPGFDGRRANAPRFLDIASANHYASAGTPPLSPGSTASPRSPYSQHSQSPMSMRIPTPDGRASTTPTQPGIVRTPSPRDGSIHLRDRIIPPAPEAPKTPLPATPSTPSMPFFEKFKNKGPPPIDVPIKSPSPPPAPPRAASPADSDDSEFEGLAYADSDDDEDDANSRRDTIKLPPPPPPPPPEITNKVRFPSMSSNRSRSIYYKSESKYSDSSSSAPSPRIPSRSLSQSTTRSSYTVRTAAKSTGALDRAMETLFEEGPASPTVSSISSPATLTKTLVADSQRDSMNRPKLPTRAHTSPGMGASRPDSKMASAKRRPTVTGVVKKKERFCLKCERNIGDEKWIQMEGGGVMCDRCWKNMYLPKCRRCNLAIEKQAVSSSDGQLKGKYHRDCFNCHTCHKPFPDRTFYVFDGKPFCAYHYHEANNSLCAAARCGQPIEGPCAVSHSGDRYHPEHFICEHPRCSEKLVDYWEVDGRMFCERHAQTIEEDEEEDLSLSLPKLENHRDSMSRATRRKTRFIDLKGLGS